MKFLQTLQLLISMYSLDSYMSRKKEKIKCFIPPDVSLEGRRLHSFEFGDGCKCDIYYFNGDVSDFIYCILSSKNCSVEFDFNGNFLINGRLKLNSDRVLALMRVVNDFDMLNLRIKQINTDEDIKACIIERIPSIIAGVSKFISI